MSENLKNLSDPFWWITAIIIGIILTFFGNFLYSILSTTYIKWLLIKKYSLDKIARKSFEDRLKNNKEYREIWYHKINELRNSNFNLELLHIHFFNNFFNYILYRKKFIYFYYYF